MFSSIWTRSSNPATNHKAYYSTSGKFIMLDGPDVHLVAPCKNYDAVLAKREAAEDDWANERAHQAGMLGGIDAYNDEWGY